MKTKRPTKANGGNGNGLPAGCIARDHLGRMFAETNSRLASIEHIVLRVAKALRVNLDEAT